MIVDIEYRDSIQHPCAYKDEVVEFYIEDGTMGWIIHCYVHDWSREKYDHILDVWLSIVDLAVVDEFYAVVKDDKLLKFAELFGFYSIDDLHDREGNKIGELVKYDYV